VPSEAFGEGGAKAGVRATVRSRGGPPASGDPTSAESVRLSDLELKQIGIWAIGGSARLPLPMTDPLDPVVVAAFKKMDLPGARRHVFLCGGPNCCATEQGLTTWETLKQRLKERNLPVLRTKAACLRICRGGPWLVVYPDGVWYGGVTPERCERIVSEHLDGGRPVSEWVAQVHPLG